MAETRTINLEIKDNFKKVEKDIDDLNKSLKDTAENNRDVSKTFEEVYGELKPLTARMGEAEDRLYELAAAGQTTTQEYKELLETVGQYRQVQIQTDLAVDGASQTMTQKLGSALNGATSAFATTQGAMALFGSENEALEESLLKVQAALAIQQGVDGLTTSYKELGGKTGIATKAQTAFNFVMNLNPILLIVSGITLAIAALLKFTSVLDPVIDGLKNFGDAIGLTDYAGEKRAANEKKRYEAELKQIQKIKEQKEKAFNNEQKAIERLIAIRSAEGKSTAELTKQKIAGSIAYQKELQKEMQLEIDRREEIIASIDKSSSFERSIALVEGFGLEGLKNANEEALNSIRDSENELKIADINAKKEAQDRRKTDADDARKLRRSIEDEEIKAIKDKDQREQTQLIVSAQRRIEDLSLTEKDAKKNAQLIKQIEQNLITDLDKLDQEWYNQQQQAQKVADVFIIQQERELLQMIEDISEQNFQLTLSDQERELLAIQDKYFTIETLAAGNSEALREIEIAKLNEFNNVNLKFQEERDRQNKEQAEKEKKREQDILEFKLNSVTETFKLISTITEMFGKKGEKAARRAFMIQKASSIAQATIETYKGANAIFASAAANPSSILFPAQPFIAAGLAVAAGVANIAKIASQKFEGGGAPSASSDTGSIPSLTGASASSFTANTNTQTTDLTTLGQGSQQGTSMSQVVVLESDITGTQNKVRLQEAKTSF